MKTRLNKIANHRYVRFAIAVGTLALFTLAAGAPAGYTHP